MLAKRIAFLGCGVVFAFCSYSVLRVQAASESGASLYSADQAKRGASEYQKQQCALCHGADLAGVGQAPPLTGDEFLSKYEDQTILVLFDKIHKTMPATNPGSMTRPQTADILAYILSSNKYAAGNTELPSEEDSLKKVQLPKPSAKP